MTNLNYDPNMARLSYLMEDYIAWIRLGAGGSVLWQSSDPVSRAEAVSFVRRLSLWGMPLAKAQEAI